MEFLEYKYILYRVCPKAILLKLMQKYLKVYYRRKHIAHNQLDLKGSYNNSLFL